MELNGKDAGQFLHNQVSADVMGLGADEATFACLCNPSGRVIGLMAVRVQEKSILALCATVLAPDIVTWLSRFILRDDVQIAMRQDLTVTGLFAEEENCEYLAELPLPGGLGYGIVKKQAADEGVVDEEEQAWKSNELANGTAWLDSHSSGKFLPQMLGFESIGALSFSKGCYPGQEVIARTRYLGRLKQHPLLVHSADMLEPGPMESVTLLSGQHEVEAVVVDSVAVPASGTQLLLVVRMPGEFLPDRLKREGTNFAIDARIPSLPAHACATT